LVATPSGTQYALKAVPKASLTSDYAKSKVILNGPSRTGLISMKATFRDSNPEAPPQ
jgi:hypothetical protein